mgnify:CR=1 FL=1
MSNIQNILDVFITKMNCFTKISVQQLTSCFIKLTQFPVPDRRVILNTNLILDKERLKQLEGSNKNFIANELKENIKFNKRDF